MIKIPFSLGWERAIGQSKEFWLGNDCLLYTSTKGTAPPENTRQQGKGSVPLRYCIQMFQI